MAVLAKESVRVVAEIVGDSKVSNEAALSLSSDVEYHMREIIQEARKCMEHSKRKKLTPEDINSALRLRDHESLYGHCFRDPLSFARVEGTRGVFYVEKKEKDLQEILNEPLPSVPLEVAFQIHWLAIEGVQPLIPQNPAPDVSPEEDPQPRGVKRPSSAISKSDASAAADKDASNEVRPNIRHALSKELQTYFMKVSEAIFSEKKEYQQAAIYSVGNDPGLHQLVPYLSRFILKEVSANLNSVRRLYDLMHLCRAILTNPYLRPEPYLHQIIPAVLTCVVGAGLEGDSESVSQWDLREYSARLAAYICARYGKEYQDVQPRVVKTYLTILLDPLKSLDTVYGSIRGLIALGQRTIQVALVPNVEAIGLMLKTKLKERDSSVAEGAQRCFTALAEAAGAYLQAAVQYRAVQAREGDGESIDRMEGVSTADGGDSKDHPRKKIKLQSNAPEVALLALEDIEHLDEYYNTFSELFGDALAPYIGDPGQYTI